jgi:hypothetical protein
MLTVQTVCCTTTEMRRVSYWLAIAQNRVFGIVVNDAA